ncbi:MAG: NADH-quinone oxidoreductase subunit NuoB [Peptococcaceae bacterium]|nr:NADH-quinone oxidoreductase subunit NuoB [Peptococcaceae bacterium]
MLRIFRKGYKTGMSTDSYPYDKKPVSSNFRGKPVWDSDKCNLCGLCVECCPTGAIAIEKSKIPYVQVEKCIFCGYCEDQCANGAVTMGDEYELTLPEKTQSERFNKGQPGFGRSVHIRHLDAGSCNGCDWEMVALTGPVYDIQRLGFDFVASPRHADILMVTGPVTRNLEIAAIRTFKATPAPKLVVAVGTCACSGGICEKSYAHHSGVENILPVDVYIPGCPPRPQALIHGLLKAVEKL